MITVEFLGPIGKDPITVKAKSLKKVSKILKEDKDLKKWLKISAVAVNDKIVKDLDIELKSGDRVSLLPPVCGG